jgi:hypothetical protein
METDAGRPQDDDDDDDVQFVESRAPGKEAITDKPENVEKLERSGHEVNGDAADRIA